MRASACWCGVIGWTWPAEGRADGWQKKLGNTFHLHVRDMLHCLGPEMMPFKCIALPTLANVNCALCFYGAHFITLHLCFFLFTWKCSEDSTEPAFVCHFVSMLPFLYKTPHFDLVWRFVMVTLHAVLRRSLGKVKAQWMVCVCVCSCVWRDLSYSIKCTLMIIRCKQKTKSKETNLKNPVWFYVAFFWQ